MLAFMAQSSPLPDLHTSTPMPSNTMSLAILPSSPMSYGQAPMPALLSPAPSPSKRPKLSLNTSTAPQVFGKGSTSLRLETLSATSPTGRNTFRNGYGQDRSVRTPGARSQRPSLGPLATGVSPVNPRLPTTLRTDLPSSEESGELTSSSAASTTSSSTVDSLSTEVPYRLAYNITSILSNGPIPRINRKMTSFAQSRPMFPAANKVSFRAPLTEDIRTSKYTMAHSDINSSSSTISTVEMSPSETRDALKHRKTKDDEQDVATTQEDGVTAASSEEINATHPRTGEKRESDEEDSDTCPATPVAGRRKKSRQWRWTLGPIDPASTESASQAQGKQPEFVEVREAACEEDL